ncbi:MAG: aldo/keto reductase [bacterium]
MESRIFGATGMSVHPLGLGGAEIGHDPSVAQKTVDRLIGGMLDGGGNVIDTAAGYADSEEKIGRAIQGRRDRCLIFTKVGPNWSPRAMRRDIERSLRRLGTDYVDLLQIWSASLSVLQRGEVIDTLESFKEEGLTRFIGYSGDADAARYAVSTGRLDSLQTSISIADQEPLELTLPLCRERKMGVIAKRPLANVAWLGEDEHYVSGYGDEYRRRLNLLRYPFLADPPEHTVSTAFRFTLSVEGVHAAIVGSKTPGRWQQNAMEWEKGPLTAGEFAEIRNRWKETAGADWRGQR